MKINEILAGYSRDVIPDYTQELYERSDKKTIFYLEQAILSSQRDKYFTIKVKSFRVIDDVKDINDPLIAEEASGANRNKRMKYNPYEFINLKPSEIIILEVVYYLATNDGASEEVTVYIDIPRIVDKYFFLVDGIYYSAMYQIVDGSTYVKSSKKCSIVTFKTNNRAFTNYRYKHNLSTIKKESVDCISYENSTINQVIRTRIPLYFLAKFGYYGALNFLNLHYINVSSYPDVRDTMYCFEAFGIFISIDKNLYNNNPVAQSFIYTIYMSLDNDVSINDIFTQAFWLQKLGENYATPTPEKGEFILDSLEHQYDTTTMLLLHLSYEDKKNIYCVLRWIVYQFKELKNKSNTDIRTKRIRFEEYIAVIYATQLSSRIITRTNNINQITVSQLKKAVTIKHDWLLKNIKSEHLVAYNDAVNDNTAIIANKFTYKGIQGIGTKKTSAVPIIYRMVYPSHLGIVDIDSSSNSDPGMSGGVCPYVYLNNGSFTDYEEPNTWRETMGELYKAYTNELNVISMFPERPVQEHKADALLQMEHIISIIGDTNAIRPEEICGYPMEGSGLIQYFEGGE